MFCSSCFRDNEEGLERCASCGEALLPPLAGGSSRAAGAPDPGASEPTGRRTSSVPAFGDPPAGAPSRTPLEAPRRPAAAPRDTEGPPAWKEDRRSHPRLEIPVNLLLRQPATDGREPREERTIAENIGRRGMRVMTTWGDLAEGDEVLVSEIEGDFETRAEVRGSWVGGDHVPRLNLRFLDGEAPGRLVGTGSAGPITPPVGVPAAERSGAPPPRAIAKPKVPVFDDGGASAEEIAARQALRDEVLTTFQSLQRISHYDLLAVPREADPAAIRTAYARRARRFHPDRATRELTGLRDAFQAILVKLGEARDVLEDPGRRRYYDSHLAPAPARTPPEGARVPSPPADGSANAQSENAEADALRAESAIAAARKLFAAEKYWDTIQLLERSIPQVQSEKLKLTMRVLWARATARNPRWRRRAEESLLEILKAHPGHVEAHFELGQIYAAGGLTSRAQRLYRKVLELDASHRGAATALNSLLTTRKL